MKILVLNCGSSSIKYQLVDMDNNAAVMAKGLLERIGLEMGEFTHKYKGEKHYEQRPIPNHTEGIKIVLAALTDATIGVISSMQEVGAVGNRIAHGGELFKDSCLIDDHVIEQIKSLEPLAPLHTPGNLAGIYAMREVLPGVPQVAVFDTAFHQTMPPKAFYYALPYKYYTDYHIRRYGAHGTSHRFVTARVGDYLGVDVSTKRIITCHIGNGASISAVKNGQCVDTSMGLTPLEGLMMGTRTGDIDSSAILTIMEKEGLTTQQANDLLNKQSGMKGFTGVSSDMREIGAAIEAGNERCKIALDMYTYRIKKYIGSYAAAMGGVDIVVFTAGVGEHQWDVREAACIDMEFLGIKLDREKNRSVNGEEAIISTPDSPVTVCVIPTDEELLIARDTLALV